MQRILLPKLLQKPLKKDQSKLVQRLVKSQKTIEQPHDKDDEIMELLKQHPDNKKYQNDDKKLTINIIEPIGSVIDYVNNHSI